MYFADIDKEKVQAYVNEPIQGSIKAVLISFFTFILFICIPISLLGIGAIITKFTLFPGAIILGIWMLKLINDNKEKKEEVILMLGIFSIYFSISLIVFIYKILSTVITVSLIYLIAGLIFYVILSLNFNWGVLKKIREGYYSSDNSKGNNSNMGTAIFLGAAVMLVSKIISPHVKQNGAIGILCMCALAFILMSSYGTRFLLKYYFIKIYNIKIECEWKD